MAGLDLMLLVGAAVGWFVIGPAVNGPVLDIFDKVSGTVSGAVSGGSAGSTSTGGSSRGSGTAPRGGRGGGGGGSRYGGAGFANAMVGGMLTHYPN